MRIYKANEKLDIEQNSGSVIALGSFDAMHIAHQKLIYTALSYAREKGLLCGVDLFSQRPEWVITGEITADCILTNEAKTHILSDWGVDFTCFENFDAAFMSMSCEEFAASLVDRFNIKCAVVGFHYRFGRQGRGDVDTLRALGKRLGFDVLVLDAVELGGQVVSSTHIRKLIDAGNVRRAADFLGRAYFIEGPVESGYQIGRTLGFPTANVEYDKIVLLPGFGVYATLAYVRGEPYKSITNVGMRPTFEGSRATVEVHLLDFAGDLYGNQLRIEFIEKIRSEKRFGSREELTEQIKRDVQAAKSLLESIR